MWGTEKDWKHKDVRREKGNKFIFIIDERDALFRETRENYQVHEEYLRLLRGLFKSSVTDKIIEGAHIPIDVGTFQNDMVHIRKKDDVLTLLVHLGYFAYNSLEKSVFIPNEEIRQEFIRAVAAGGHKEVAKLIQNSDMLLEHTCRIEKLRRG